MDCVDPIASEPVEEREDNMSSLATGFSATMSKRAASAQGETTPNFEVPDDKRPKRSSPDDMAQKSQAVSTLNSPKRASNALSALKGAA